jgi:hypothetical protein
MTGDELLNLGAAINAKALLEGESEFYTKLGESIREVCDKLWYTASIVELTGNKLHDMANNYVGVENSTIAYQVGNRAGTIRENIQDAIKFDNVTVKEMLEEIDQSIKDLEVNQETAAPSEFVESSYQVLKNGNDQLTIEKENGYYKVTNTAKEEIK